jgi:hypothetical protein
MSRQLIFSSAISVMVMASFALSTTVKAADVAGRSPVTQVGTVSGR